MSDKNFPFRGIVLEGGGPTCIGHVGALEILEQKGILGQLTHFVGSSAGSIVASALACRASTAFLKQKLTVDFTTFLDNNCISKNIYRVFSKYGFYKGDYLEKWIGVCLKELTGNSDITLKQVYEMFGTFLEISITDFTLSESIYVNYLNNPDLPVKTAVRRSSMMTMIFAITSDSKPTPVLDDNTDTVITKNLKHIYTDGGVLDNYPMHRLDNYLSEDQVIGIRLMTSKRINEVNNPGVARYESPKNLVEFLTILINTFRDNSLRAHIEEKDWVRSIRINVGHVSSSEFNISDTDREFLLNQGRKGANEFFDRYIQV